MSQEITHLYKNLFSPPPKIELMPPPYDSMALIINDMLRGKLDAARIEIGDLAVTIEISGQNQIQVQFFTFKNNPPIVNTK